MPADEAERTEPATAKRRQDARRKGDVAQSRELQTVAILATALLAAGSLLGARLVVGLARQAEAAWSGHQVVPHSLGDFHALILNHFVAAGAGVVPLLLLLALAGGVTQLAQTGPMLSAEALRFRGDRMDPFKGLKRMFSAERVMDLAKALFKVAVVGGITWAILSSALGPIAALSDVGVKAGLVSAGRLARKTAVLILLALTVMALLDIVWVRFRYEKKLRMTRKEVRDEHKQREGSPQVRSRMRTLQRELSRSRMIAAVAEADVVVTNPVHYAVALRYDRSEMGAPTVLAKGRSHVARRIREAAQRHGVPVVENPPLARLLHRSAEVGREIPEALFQAVAEVLAFVYRLNPKRADAWGARR